MSLPVVAIVGRPNVGKSSLLNCLSGRRIAIVDATPGVTRDRISAPCALDEDRWVELVDTGGLGMDEADNLAEHVAGQIDYAVRAAEVILFVVDAREGLTPLDRKVADMLRRQDKPVVLLANKADKPGVALETGELHKLGFGEPLVVSATHRLGRDDILRAVADRLAGRPPAAPPQAVMKLAVIGKRNAGKSTFINALAGGPRVIVSQTPGTTRDSVDVNVEMDGRTFVLIDTAGVRKKRKIADSVEFYSIARTNRSVRRADVAAFLIDASLPVSRVDKNFAGLIAGQFKPVVLVVNKWDIAAGKAEPEQYADYLRKTFPQFDYAPVSLAAAVDGTNVRRTVELAEQLYEQANSRVPTARLNQAIEEIMASHRPPRGKGKKSAKIYYASQVSTAPPTIVCFVNDLACFTQSYRRFILNRLREYVPFAEIPIRLLFRPRRREAR